MKHKHETALPREDASEDFKAGTTEHGSEAKGVMASKPHQDPPLDEYVKSAGYDVGGSDAVKGVSPKDDIAKEIADHEKWMSEHTDDARGVQERLQKISALQAKLAELDAPKPEQRVRQTQTV